MYCPIRCRYLTDQFWARNYPVSWQVVQGPEWKYAKFRPYQSPWYRICTKAMVISKGSYGHGESKNVLPQSVQIPCLLVRGKKLPRFMGGSIGPRMEICETSALPIPMVRRLHQSNGYIKRKLRAWRVQKSISRVSGDIGPITAWPQSTPFHWWQYRAQNGNMRNFSPTNPNGTAFAPKQWLYQKEATGIQSSKMYCHSRCRYRTYLCVEAKYPVSCGVVQGTECKYAKHRPYQSPWYGVRTKAMVISKVSYGNGESKNVLPKSVQTPYLPLRGSKVPRFMGGSIGRRMEICETSGLPIPMVPRLRQTNGYIKRKLRAWRVQKCIAIVGANIVLMTAWPQSIPFHGGQYKALNGNMRNFGPTNPHGTGSVCAKAMVISKGSYGH